MRFGIIYGNILHILMRYLPILSFIKMFKLKKITKTYLTQNKILQSNERENGLSFRRKCLH